MKKIVKPRIFIFGIALMGVATFLTFYFMYLSSTISFVGITPDEQSLKDQFFHYELVGLAVVILSSFILGQGFKRKKS